MWNRLDCLKTLFYGLWLVAKLMPNAQKFHMYAKG